MRYRTFGRTGLFVSELCFRSMIVGGTSGMCEKIGTTPQQEGDRPVGVALDAGIDFFDTADVCAEGESERSRQVAGRAPQGRGAGQQGARCAQARVPTTWSCRAPTSWRRSMVR